jgi:uncharacterized protein YabE (DUF348 family)
MRLKKFKRPRIKFEYNPTHFEGLKNHPFVVPVTTFLVLFFVTIVVFIGFSGGTVGAGDSRVVQITIDGKKQVLPTRASTVGDLLDRLNIKTRSEDIIEPAKDTQILDDNFTVKVDHAKPVIIIDGGRRQIAYSAGDTPQAIAQKAGITVYPEDKVTKQDAVDNPTEVLKEGIAAEKVVISRAKPVNINLYGTPIAFRTQAQTVGDLLKEKNIKPIPGDSVQPAPETLLTDNILVFVLRQGKQVQNQEEIIPMPVETISDPSLGMGQTVVRQPGAPGKKVVTYEIELTNSKETGRKVLQEVIVSQPVKQVVARGSRVLLTGSKADWLAGSGIGGGDYGSADYIISHESGWRPGAVSGNRCIGLGQSCGSSLAGACPNWSNDPVCQLNFFDRYAKSRYGSWSRAYQFWTVNHWW